MLFPKALNVAIVATAANVGVTGITAVLMEFIIVATRRYFFSCSLMAENKEYVG